MTTNSTIQTIDRLCTLDIEIKEYERNSIPFDKFTIEELDCKAISLGYTGWNDSRYIGELSEVANEFEVYNVSNSYVIVDTKQDTIYWAYGYSGQMLLDQLLTR